MESKNMAFNHEHLLKHLTNLPKKILSMHDTENLTEFVLHDLCNKNCFNLSKAAYFINNPDFDKLKGVAGYNDKEDFVPYENLWDDPEEFSKHMRNCEFNNRVRAIEKSSIKDLNDSSKELFVNDLSKELELQEPIYYFWGLKNDNHGLFIFECTSDHENIKDELLKGLCLLGFCPVF